LINAIIFPIGEQKSGLLVVVFPVSVVLDNLYKDGGSGTSSDQRPMELRINWPLRDFEGFACWLICPEQHHDHDGHNQLFDLDVFDIF
jgi:hypothetical protein